MQNFSITSSNTIINKAQNVKKNIEKLKSKFNKTYNIKRENNKETIKYITQKYFHLQFSFSSLDNDKEFQTNNQNIFQ